MTAAVAAPPLPHSLFPWLSLCLCLSGLDQLSSSVVQTGAAPEFPQPVVELSTMDTEKYFNRTIRIGAAISEASDGQFSSYGVHFMWSFELFAKWVNLDKGGIRVGDEKWGVELIQIDDYSNIDYCNFAAEKLLSSDDFDVDFMFGPYSSYLTKGVIERSDNASKVLIAPGSSFSSVWDGTVKYGIGTLLKSGLYYEDLMNYYHGVGAQTTAVICSKNEARNTCLANSEAEIESMVNDAGMTLSHYIQLDRYSDNFAAELNDTITMLAAADPDVLVLNDWKLLCVDVIEAAQAIRWTPKGLTLQLCWAQSEVQEQLGDAIWYSTTYEGWSSDAIYTSGISGYSNTEFVEMYEAEFHEKPLYQGASAFAAGEILVAAIEKQATINASLIFDAPTLSSLILNGSWSTLQSIHDLTFSDLHQAQGQYVILQCRTSYERAVLYSSSDLYYPMPIWEGRTVEPPALPTSRTVSVDFMQDSEAEPAHCDPLVLDQLTNASGLCNLRSAVTYCLTNPLKSPFSNCTVQMLLPAMEIVLDLDNFGDLDVSGAVGSLIVLGYGCRVVSSSNSSRMMTAEIPSSEVFHFVLRNMSISNFGSMDVESGGAFYLKNVASALIQDVIFENNVAQVGAAVTLDESRSVTFISTSFVDNVALAAGAVYAMNGNDEVFFLDCHFLNNSAAFRGLGDEESNGHEHAGKGGAVMLNSDNRLIQFSKCVFANNSAEISGGAAHVISNNPQIIFSQCQFLNQNAQEMGGAIYLYMSNENVRIKRCLFSNNFAGLGAAVYAHSLNADLSMTNCTVESNKATIGSCVYLNSHNDKATFTEVVFLGNIADSYGTVFINSDNNFVSFLSCEFSENVVRSYGAGLYIDSSNTNLVINQCLFAANQAVDSGILYFNSKNHDCSLLSSSFIRNTVERDGGCVSLTSRNYGFHVDNCSFSSNVAGVAGGAIHSAILNDDMRITNSHISNCTAGSHGSALYFGSDHKNIFISECSFSNNQAESGTIYVSRFNQNVTLASCVLQNNIATSQIGGVISLADTLLITSSHFMANKNGAIYVEAVGSALVHACNISHTQGTGVFIRNSEFVEVQFSTFMNNIGGTENGGALSITSSERVSVTDSIFEKNECSGDGASMSMSNNQLVDINRCTFKGNIAATAGGAIYATESPTLITSSTFLENQCGTFGSAIFATAISSMNITNNQFTRNYAILAGTVYWVFLSGMAEPGGLRSESNTFAADNMAVYGERWATEGTALGMESSSDSGEVHTSYDVTQYQHAVPSFAVILKDFYNQTVLIESTEDVSIAVLSVLATECFDSVGYLAEGARERFVNGTALFSSLVAYCAPRHTLSLEAQSSHVSSASFQLHFRDCFTGEYYGESECYACEKGSYSLLDPAGSSLDELTQAFVCKPCHSSAEDCHGDQIVLKEGYWRRFEYSSHIMECPLEKQSCVGGNSTGDELCALGYEDALCAVCSSNYFQHGDSCVECSAKHMITADLVIFCVLVLIVIGVVGSFGYFKVIYSNFEINSEASSSSATHHNNEKSATAAGQTPGSRDRSKSFIEQQFETVNTWYEDHFNLLMRKVKIAVATLQVVSTIPGNLQVSMPKSFTEFTNALKFIQLDLAALFPLSCSAKYSFIDSLILNTLLPILVSVILVIAFFVEYRNKRQKIQANQNRKRGEKAELLNKIKGKYMNYFLNFTFLILPSITTKIFQTFLCTNVDEEDEDNEDTDSYMTFDMGVSCKSSYFAFGVTYAAIACLVYPIGIPCLYMYYLYQNRVEIKFRQINTNMHVVPVCTATSENDITKKIEERESVGNPLHPLNSQGLPVCGTAGTIGTGTAGAVEEQRRLSPEVLGLSFLWEAYQPDFWYWEVVETGRRLVLTALLSVCAPGTSTQTVMAVFMCMVFIELYGYYKPYAEKQTTQLSKLGLIQILLTFQFALILQNDLLPGDVWEATIGIVLILLNVTVVAVIIYFEIPAQWVSRAIFPPRGDGAAGVSAKSGVDNNSNSMMDIELTQRNDHKQDENLHM